MHVYITLVFFSKFNEKIFINVVEEVTVIENLQMKKARTVINTYFRRLLLID